MRGAIERVHDVIEEHRARSESVRAAISSLDQLAAERELPPDAIEIIRVLHEDRLKQIENRSGEDARQFSELRDDLERQLIAVERARINELYRAGELKDELRRRIERDLDMREAFLFNQRKRA